MSWFSELISVLVFFIVCEAEEDPLEIVTGVLRIMLSFTLVYSHCNPIKINAAAHPIIKLFFKLYSWQYPLIAEIWNSSKVPKVL